MDPRKYSYQKKNKGTDKTPAGLLDFLSREYKNQSAIQY